MDHDIRRTHALAFGPAAERYDRIRPSYPTEAVQWLLEPAGPGPLRVVDLGAGTGILTRVLLTLGHEVLPVEPDPAMRERLSTTTPGARPLDGTAERIPLPAGSVDAVVAGQAYHWFDTGRAHDEIARVLRDGGVFSPLWNDRDVRVPWVARLSTIINGEVGWHRTDPATSTDVESFGPRFAPVERAEFRHSTTLTSETLVELVKSRSYYLTASPDGRARLEAAVRALAAADPSLAGRDEFELPYVTRGYRARTAARSARTPGEDRSG